MKTIIVSNEYYSIIDLTLEYKNWTGQEKYAVISSLEQGYIETTFAKELKDYKPFIFMNESCMDVFNEYERNNEKYRYRYRKHHTNFDIEEDDTDKYNQAFSVPNFDTAWILLDEIHNALSLLTEKERVRTYCFYFKKMSLKEIAQKYNCAVTSVEDSIANARKKLKKFIKNP